MVIVGEPWTDWGKTCSLAVKGQDEQGWHWVTMAVETTRLPPNQTKLEQEPGTFCYQESSRTRTMKALWATEIKGNQHIFDDHQSTQLKDNQQEKLEANHLWPEGWRLSGSFREKETSYGPLQGPPSFPNPLRAKRKAHPTSQSLFGAPAKPFQASKRPLRRVAETPTC